jgi:lactate permease
MIMMMTRFFGTKRSRTEGLSILPFALLSGLAFTIPYALTGVLLGPEFPSLLGALVGLAIVTFSARRGFLLPDDRWDFPDTKKWDERWRGSFDVKLDTLASRRMSISMAWFPYVLVALLLVLSRLPQLPFAAWLKSLTLTWRDVLGTDITAASQPLYLPGSMLVLTVLITLFLLFQHSVADGLMITGSLVVALQAVGAAGGNMIAIHNVVADSATVGLLGREGEHSGKQSYRPCIMWFWWGSWDWS